MTANSNANAIADPILIADCVHGIYAPQVATMSMQGFFVEADEEDIAAVLSGPDNEFYSWAWDNLSQCQLNINGAMYQIHCTENGDIFACTDAWLEQLGE